MWHVQGASGDRLWQHVAGVMGVAGESCASQQHDLLVNSASIGSGGRVSCASEAYSLTWLKASQRYLALGELGDVYM